MYNILYINMDFLLAQLVKNLPAKRETWVQSLGWEDPMEGKGYPLQYSGLENFTDCIVHGVTKSWTQVKQLSTAQHSYEYLY